MYGYTSVSEVLEARRKLEIFIVIVSLIITLAVAGVLFLIFDRNANNYERYTPPVKTISSLYVNGFQNPPPFSPPSDMRWEYKYGGWQLVEDTELDSLVALFERFLN